jgi:hypothetical protein
MHIGETHMNYIDNIEMASNTEARLRGINHNHNPTVEENIDNRIRFFKEEIARLEQSKIDLQPLLKMRIQDIRSAMDY